MTASSAIRIADRDELVAALRDTDGPLHVRGQGTHETLLPPAEATTLSLAGMRRVVRLEPGDLTATVEPGLPLADLRAALAEHGLELPCAGVDGPGSVGGLFACGLHGPAAPTAPSPRSLLLGLEGALADGTVFKSGAAVVKNVAGFDLHKAFVGSRGRLLAATLLHLKLRVRPRARAAFEVIDLDAATAVRRLHALRTDPVPPATVRLRRAAGGACTLHGCVEGTPRWVADRCRHLAVTSIDEDALPPTALQPPAKDRVLLVGGARPRAFEALLAGLPDDATACLDGSGGVVIELSADAADDRMAALAKLGGAFERLGGPPAARGRATPRPPATAALEAALRARLDPGGRWR